MISTKSIDFYDKILFEIKQEPKTISQIANKLKINYDSTKNHILELEHLGFLIKIVRDDKEYFDINPNPQSKKDFGTYFNLPISEIDKNKLETYYYLIRKYWIEITNQKPTITQVYKVLAKLNYKLNLELPIGWYNYGLMPVLIYKEESLTEEKIQISSEFKRELLNIIEEYSKFPQIRKLIQKQYEDFNKKSYSTKEKILNNLYYNIKEDYINKNLIENFRNLIKYVTKDELDRDVIYYLNDFYGILLNFKEVSKKVKSFEEFNDYKEVLINSFKELWKLVAIDYYKNSLKNISFCDESILNLIFKKEIELQQFLLEQSLYEILEIIEVNIDKSKQDNTKLNQYFQKIKLSEKIKVEKINQNETLSLEEQEKMLKDLGLL